MKLHYTKILLFSLLLNILAHNKNKSYTTIHTPITTSRVLIECNVYIPNYDNDPDMKSVKENFDRQTSQRFEEYNERMIDKRQKCKEQCEKDIQKIILKDKIEKELAEKFVTLQTDISINDIPTCVCEKSVADKVEKTCLKCGGVLGGGITPGWGLISGIVYTGWKAAALAAAKKAAIAEGAAKGLAEGIKEGIQEVMKGLCRDFRLSEVDVKKLGLVFDGKNYNNTEYIFKAIFSKFDESCMPSSTGAVRGASEPICNSVWSKFVFTNRSSSRNSIINAIKENVETIVSQAETTAGATKEMVTQEVTSAAIKTNTTAVNATYASCQTVIIASVVAIVVIVLVMIIIYLVLRYRRKKKMKKKLEYIKLLKE
ncbi:rifin [Plasmodium falciparum NF54]|uniref:Rifin n=2 Tax=Plasmodium falciparum TaxID=5833 RepID=Q8IIZ9_PLAF7|nr:rifin [Plasmodium falciparum 3D7]EWC88233.1 hypothetical protein PFNF54_02978 [Plasmodium falciparum NF54]KAF4330845.1 rifin [Plasmodium falciparum NF54]PKC43439.1 rifin [Plasmodium falciparum NF54]CZT98665.1 rifin [Plasmodium falciparum 3D7]|eukprot:XP_001347687.1 rifin [Plasmodium falciparum 3D7]